MEKTYEERIKETVSGLLEKLGFEALVEVISEEGLPNTFFCKVRVEKDQHFLIGQHGANLAAVQHLIRVMLHKKMEERLSVIVDVNDYFAEKRVLLEREAQKASEEALRDNISVALRPMLPYERKIVHSFLSTNPRITTESVNQGGQRKIMVSPKSDESPSEEEGIL